jgi:hypothetical protein
LVQKDVEQKKLILHILDVLASRYDDQLKQQEGEQQTDLQEPTVDWMEGLFGGNITNSVSL